MIKFLVVYCGSTLKSFKIGTGLYGNSMVCTLLYTIPSSASYLSNVNDKKKLRLANYPMLSLGLVIALTLAASTIEMVVNEPLLVVVQQTFDSKNKDTHCSSCGSSEWQPITSHTIID